MTIRWYPDTCDCILEYNKNVNWTASIQYCRLHKSLRGQTHLDTVLAQNQRFNLALGSDILNEDELRILILTKQINKKRIKIENLTNFVEDLPDRPEELSVGFWENIRNRLPF